MLMACGKIACCAMAFANNELKTDEMYLNALDNQVLQDSVMISLNYLPRR